MLRNIVILSLFAALFVGSYSCTTDKDNIVSNQRTQIEKYLEAREMEYTIRQGVYCYVMDTLADNYNPLDSAQKGDVLEFYYTMYPFVSSTGYSPRNPIYSTHPAIIDSMKNHWYEQSLPTLQWGNPDNLPSVKTLGSSKMVKALSRGLVDSKQGQTLMLIVTSDLAFGEDKFATLPENTPLVYIVNIEKLTKKE